MLRKGCSDNCILRPCLQWIETSEAQGHATVFVAKFFGRAGLMGFISAVPENQRSALFQSLLYEACGRTVNPVFGAVGLLWSGNWQICQAAVDTVLKGGTLRPSSPSSLPSYTSANLSFAAPCFPALAMPGNFATPAAGKVDDPIQITLSSNAPAENSLDQHTVSLGIGLPEDNYAVSNERLISCHDKMNSGSWHSEAVVAQNMETNSTWRNDGQCDNWNPLHSAGEFQRDGLGHKSNELKQRGTHMRGEYVTPRRVKGRVQASPEANFLSGERACEELPVPGNGAEQLELDLTLKVKGVKGEKTVGNKRQSSPCDSVKSEGSVTSLDSSVHEPPKPCNWALEMSLMPPTFRTLLPLMQ